MNKDEFIETLRSTLSGLTPAEIDDVVADYATHFAEAAAAGRDEAEVSAALGDPRRLAKELQVEIGLKRWQTHRTPTTLAKALVALTGLAVLDAVIFLPFLITVLIIVLLGFLLFAAAVVGIGLIASLFFWSRFNSIGEFFAQALAAISLLGGVAGLGALLLLVIEAIMRGFGRLSRIHHVFLKKNDGDA